MDHNSGSGIGFFGILTIVFVVLKLCKIVSWPWVWVLCPFWIGAILFVFIIVIGIWISKR